MPEPVRRYTVLGQELRDAVDHVRVDELAHTPAVHPEVVRAVLEGLLGGGHPAAAGRHADQPVLGRSGRAGVARPGVGTPPR